MLQPSPSFPLRFGKGYDLWVEYGSAHTHKSLGLRGITDNWGLGLSRDPPHVKSAQSAVGTLPTLKPLVTEPRGLLPSLSKHHHLSTVPCLTGLELTTTPRRRFSQEPYKGFSNPRIKSSQSSPPSLPLSSLRHIII